VADAQIVELAAGKTLVRQGEQADRIFVLLDGRLDVVVEDDAGNERALGDVVPGSIVGEIPVLVGGNRTLRFVPARSRALRCSARRRSRGCWRVSPRSRAG
jgi:CRP-like cAMP-binding protein